MNDIPTVDCEGNVEALNSVRHCEVEISRDLILGKTEHFMPLNCAYFITIIDCADVGAGSDGHNIGAAVTDEEILGMSFSVTIY